MPKVGGKRTGLKRAARSLGRVGSKAVRFYANPIVFAAETAWDLGSYVEDSHHYYGKKSTLEKVRTRTRASAKAGKPRYDSWGKALKADRNKR